MQRAVRNEQARKIIWERHRRMYFALNSRARLPSQGVEPSDEGSEIGLAAIGSSASLNTASLRYEIVTDLAAAERIVPAWNELLDRSTCNRAFSSPIWFLAACQVQPEFSPWLGARMARRESGGRPAARGQAGDAGGDFPELDEQL